MTQSPKNVSWLKTVTDAGVIVWGIAIGTALVLISVALVLQQATLKEREMVFHNTQDINSKIVLSDEVRLRSHLATLDKVMLVLRRDYADNPKMTNQQLLDRLVELKLDSKLTPRIFFLDALGDMTLLAATSGKGMKLTTNFSDREYFRAQERDHSDVLRVGAPFESRVSGAWSIPLTRRITNKDGSFGGVIGVAVDPGLFTEPFEQANNGVELSRSVIGLDGYTRVRLIGGTIEYGGDVRNSQIFKEIKKSNAGSYTAISAADGVKRLVSYRLIDPYGIIIVSGASVSSVEQMYAEEVRNFDIAAFLFGVLVLLLSGLLIYGIARQRKLFESQQNFNQLIELVPQLISRLDVDGNIIWVNSRTLEYVGASAEVQAKGFEWVLAAFIRTTKTA